MAIRIPGASAPHSQSAPGRSPSAAALRAQLAQYQKQLSDCVNCASSSTREGQAKIQALNARIEALRGQLDSAVLAQTEARPAGSAPYGASSAASGSGTTDQLRSNSGLLLNVYA